MQDDPCIRECTFAAVQYVIQLDKFNLPWVGNKYPFGATFQQDCAASHTAKNAQELEM